MSRPIAVLVKRFPKLSETFILGEIAALVDFGLNIHVISLHRPNETLQQPGAMRFADRVTYIEPVAGLRRFIALVMLFLRNPAGGLKTLMHLRESGVNMGQLGALIGLCEELDVGHLHAHYISGPALLADLTARACGITFSVSAHAKDIYLTDPCLVRERLHNAAFVSTCTAHNYRYLAGLSGSAAAKIHLVYHGIDSETFRPADIEVASQAPLLIAVGRYKEKKGFDLLISACASLLLEGVTLRCEIIGYGDQQSQLQQLITDKGLEEHVRLRTPVNHDDLVGILQNASLCVLPCRQTENGDRDGIPNAMLEAMSCAVPVVSTPVSGIPEVIRSGINGILVEPENPQALAQAIRSVLDDRKLRRKLADAGRDTVQEMFSWQSNMTVLGEMLDGTVANADCCERV